jgi:hypothetical protein
MDTTQLCITAAFLVAASSCSASSPSSDFAAPTTALSTSTTSTSLAPVALNSREAGLELLDTCLAAINTAPAEFGLTGDDVVERFGAVLPPTVYDFAARPVQTEFEFKADEL